MTKTTNKKLWYKEIDKQLDVMREKLKSHLSNAEQDIFDALGIEVEIKFGKIGYTTDSNSELRGWTSKLELDVADKKAEPIQLTNFCKLLVKEKVLKNVKDITGQKFIDRKGDEIVFTGLDLKKPKNCMVLSVNGKDGYMADMGYFVYVAELDCADNKNRASDVQKKRDKDGMTHAPFGKGSNGVVDYLKHLMMQNHYELGA